MIKGSIRQGDITIKNTFASNFRVLKYIKQILAVLKGKIDDNMIIIGDFNNPLLTVYRSSRQEINKETWI